MDVPEIIKSLREALKFSPENVPLKKHLAEMLYQHGMYADAEKEYKEALSLSPENNELKLGLAKTFFQLEKVEAASIIIDELLGSGDTKAELYILYSRILSKNGEFHKADQYYKKAIAKDNSLKDDAFEQEVKDNLGRDPQSWLEREAVKVDQEEGENHVDVERPTQNFEGVGGMENVKEEIRLKIIHPLKNPEIYKAYGKSIGGGILLYGPPGCGKTHLARATAGEVKASFISVGISDILDMWVGSSEKNLNAIFEKARSQKPCVLFFDEVDALGANRTDMRKTGGKSVINQFLTELDGINSQNEGLLILAATNAPWHLDPAFRRSGRFDRIIFVPPPDEAAREGILRILLKGKPAENIDYKSIAKKTPEFSGADLKAVVDIAIEGKLNESLKKGIPLPINNNDLKDAIGKHRATTKEWFSTAKNYALYANDSGIYDDILSYLKIKK